MTAKKAQISTMILLVVPLGFSTGTELLKTMAHKSHTDFPIVKVEPPASGQNDEEEKIGRKKREGFMRVVVTFLDINPASAQQTQWGIQLRMTAYEAADSN